MHPDMYECKCARVWSVPHRRGVKYTNTYTKIQIQNTKYTNTNNQIVQYKLQESGACHTGKESNAPKFLKSHPPKFLLLPLETLMIWKAMMTLMTIKKILKLDLRDACPRSIRPKRGSHAMQIATYTPRPPPPSPPKLPPSPISCFLIKKLNIQKALSLWNDYIYKMKILRIRLRQNLREK